MKPAIGIIDIGSNSVRLMIGAIENGRVRALSKELDTTRLAEGIDRSHRLAEDRVADSVRAIGAYAEKAAALNVPVYAYATSAVRDAENRDAFVARVLERTGVHVRVLSGGEEGYYAFSAVTGGVGTVFDIGGGSFQIVTKDCALSFPCGCVRAKAQCDASDLHTLRSTLFAWMDARSDVPDTVPLPVYGVGGTISSIGAILAGQTVYDPNRLEPISRPRLNALLDVLSAIPERERMRHPLLGKRGEVILQGAMILQYMMLRTNVDRVVPSDRDGMEGIAEAYLMKDWNG
jgi:exopolyphosphatase/guanosine-5'-triphosphate,3'-diphosphate pyrophosphatase